MWCAHCFTHVAHGVDLTQCAWLHPTIWHSHHLACPCTALLAPQLTDVSSSQFTTHMSLAPLFLPLELLLSLTCFPHLSLLPSLPSPLLPSQRSPTNTLLLSAVVLDLLLNAAVSFLLPAAQSPSSSSPSVTIGSSGRSSSTDEADALSAEGTDQSPPATSAPFSSLPRSEEQQASAQPLLPAGLPRPQLLAYDVINTYPHDPRAFTQVMPGEGGRGGERGRSGRGAGPGRLVTGFYT